MVLMNFSISVNSFRLEDYLINLVAISSLLGLICVIITDLLFGKRRQALSHGLAIIFGMSNGHDSGYGSSISNRHSRCEIERKQHLVCFNVQ